MRPGINIRRKKKSKKSKNCPFNGLRPRGFRWTPILETAYNTAAKQNEGGMDGGMEVGKVDRMGRNPQDCFSNILLYLYCSHQVNNTIKYRLDRK